MSSSFASRLATGEILILDGGLATELERHGKSLQHDLWSAKFTFFSFFFSILA